MNPLFIRKISLASKAKVKFSRTFMYAGISLLFASAAVPSCQTVQGFGNDVEDGGNAIERAAS